MSDSNSFAQLQRLYQIVTPENLLGRYRLEKFSNVKPDVNVLGRVLDAFVNTVDASGSGLLLYDEIKGSIADLKSKSTDAALRAQIDADVKLYEDVSLDVVLGSQRSAASTTQLRVVSLAAPTLSISLRDVNRTGVFMNSVPSLELSRCQPLLEIGFELAFPGEDADKSSDPRFAAGLSARSPTLLRYLNGTAGSYGSADLLMAQGSLHKVDLSSRTNSASDKKSWKDSSFIASGMELFTSPQTLTSPDSTLSARQVPVLDRFASLMTIESFEITATPSGGTMSYKTARLNLVLHDRSRLHEVAALIKPDAYSRTTVSITYGWSHPDTSGNSPIADLINQMVVRDEKYNIVNSSFSFGQGGGAKITLQLATKGASELSVIRIADSEQFSKLELKLQQLSEAIRDARERIPGLTKPDFVTKDVRVFQIIDAAANNAELIDNYKADKDKADLTRFIHALQSGKANQSNASRLPELQSVLKDLLDFLDGKNASNATFAVASKNDNRVPLIDNVLGDKFKTMIGQLPGGKFGAAPDPYLDETARYWSDKSNAISPDEISKVRAGSSTKPRLFVSLAKLLLFYVGLPLQSLGQLDEVQFVYYPFNSEAGLASGTSLAGFPVEVSYFRDVLADHAKRKGNANLTVREFVQLLASSVLSDVRNWAYGLREFYVDRPSGKPSEEPVLKRNATVQNATDKLLKANVSNGTFRKPVVEVQVECRGGRPLAQGELASDKSTTRIVRIHVYDKLSSAYEPTLKVLEAQQGLQALEGNPNDGTTFQQLTTVANQIGLDLKEQRFSSYDDLKRFISQVTPVLNYGANDSGIVAATLQTMQNSDLATVNMQRSMGPQYNTEPNGSSVSAIPLRVQPSQLDLTLIGCPLLGLAQQYFVDFNTGTTVDDLYVLTHLSHRIAAGKFESTAKLTPMNAYGAYESVASKVRKLKVQIDNMLKASKT